MKNPCMQLAAVLLIALSPWAVQAQTSTTASPAAPVASAVPAAAKPTIVTNTPEAKRDRADAAVADENRPDRPVTSQVSIPLGKKLDTSGTGKNLNSPYGNSAASGGIDDNAAACLAKSDAAARAKCQSQLPKESSKPK